MKKMFALTIAAALMFSAFIAAQGRSAAEEFKAAQHKETVEGDVKGAIDAYKKIAKGKDHEFAAKALVALGDAYRRSKDADAKKIYQQVVSEFPEQKESVALAQARLKELAAGSAPSVSLFKAQTRLGQSAVAVTPDGRYLLNRNGVEIDVLTKAERALGQPEGQTLNNRTGGSIGPVRSFAVSSDGQQIAFGLNSPKGAPVQLNVLYRNASNARQGKMLFRSEVDSDIQAFGWSPDNKEIFAVLAGKDNSHRIAAISSVNGVLRTIKLLEWREPRKLSLSPDGRYIAYDAPVAKQSADRDIYIVSTEGGVENTITQDPARNALPVWTPDGGSIVFASDRSGSLGLWIVNLANGKPRGAPRQLTVNEGLIWPIGFSRDGSFYYNSDVGGRVDRSDIYTEPFRSEADGTTARPSPVSLISTSGRNDNPRYSPDGKSLAYLSRRNPSFYENPDRMVGTVGDDSAPVVVHVRSLESGAERQFSTGLTVATGLRWSADGRGIRFEGRSGSTSPYSSRRIDLQTGAQTNTDLPDLPGIVGSPCVSPEGKRTYFMRPTPTGSGRGVVAYDMDTRHETALFSLEGPGRESPVSPDCGSFLSPDGQYLFASMYNLQGRARGPGVSGALPLPNPDVLGYAIPTTGGTPTMLTLPSQVRCPCVTQWSVDARKILVIHDNKPVGTRGRDGLRNSDRSAIWQIPIDGGAPIEIGTVTAPFADSVNLDGKQAAYTARQSDYFEPGAGVVPDLLQSNNGGHGVFLAGIDPGGGKVRGPVARLTETRSLTSFEQSPAWSPDGESIAFKRRLGPEGYLVVRSLKTGAETSYPTTLVRLSVDTRLAWLHDGGVFVAGSTADLAEVFWGTEVAGVIRRADPKTRRFQEILRVLGTGSAAQQMPLFAVSPDDKTLYFADNAHPVQGSVGIIAFDLASGRQSPAFTLPAGLGLVAGMDLSPDGRTFAMWTALDSATGESRFFRIQTDGSGYREFYREDYSNRPTQVLQHADLVRWTKDGKAILVGKQESTSNNIWQILRIPAEGGAPVSIGLQVTVSENRELRFDLSPDGSRIAFEGTAATISPASAR